MTTATTLEFAIMYIKTCTVVLCLLLKATFVTVTTAGCLPIVQLL